jgi:hypothetical protein
LDSTNGLVKGMVDKFSVRVLASDVIKRGDYRRLVMRIRFDREEFSVYCLISRI